MENELLCGSNAHTLSLLHVTASPDNPCGKGATTPYVIAPVKSLVGSTGLEPVTPAV